MYHYDEENEAIVSEEGTFIYTRVSSEVGIPFCAYPGLLQRVRELEGQNRNLQAENAALRNALAEELDTLDLEDQFDALLI